MTTRSESRGRWFVRCDRCGAISPDPAPTAALALAAMRRVGWDRVRPGLEDFCVECLSKS